MRDWQAPVTHTAPAGHVMPHPPQFELSVMTSTHTPLHTINPELHPSRQRPNEHA